MEAKHTPGRISAETYEGGGFDIRSEDGHGFFGTGVLVICSRGQHVSRADEMHANARRLAACWNACDGVPTPDLEVDNVLFAEMLRERSTLKTQRDELLLAAIEVMQWIEIAHRPPIKDEFEIGRMVRVRLHALANLRDVIAKATGQP